MKIKTLVLSAFIAISAASCSKKDNDPAPTTNTTTKTPKDLLLGSWVEVKLTYKEQGEAEVTILPKDCEKDDFETYQSDGKFIDNNGTLKCSTGEDQTVTDSYTLSMDGKTLTYTYADGSGSLSLAVLELTDSKLVLRYSDAGDVSTVEYKRK